MAGVVGAFFVTNRHWQSLRTQQAVVNADYDTEAKKIDQLKSLEGQRSAIMEKAEITAALIEKTPRWAVLGELTLRMPRTMRLDLFSIKGNRVQPPAPPPAAPGQKTQSLAKDAKAKDPKAKDAKAPPAKVEAPRFDYVMTAEGTAEENNNIADFLTSMKKSPIFDKVELAFIRDLKEGDRDLRKFQVTATLRAPKSTDVLAASLQDLMNTRTKELALLKAEKEEQMRTRGTATAPANLTADANNQVEQP